MASEFESGAQAGSNTTSSPQAQAQAVFHRLVRSLSPGGRSGTSTASLEPAQRAPPADLAATETPRPTSTRAGEGESAEAAAMPASSSASASADPEPGAPAGPLSSSTQGAPLQRVSSTSSSLSLNLKEARSKIADRLKQLGQGMSKLRRGKNKAVPASPRVTLGEVEVASSTAAYGAEHEHEHLGQGHAKLLSMVAEQDEPAGTIRYNAIANANDNDQNAPPSAMTLAKRIQSLIDALPFPSPAPAPSPSGTHPHPSTPTPIPVPTNPSPPDRDEEGRPIFPPDTTPVKDGNLISWLSSATVMNGSTARGRPSIWSVLEKLGVPPHGFPSRGGGEGAGAGEEDAEGQSQGEGGSGAVSHGNPPSEGTPPQANPHPILSDDTSVLLYSPLFPSAEDLVELGEQVPIAVDEVVPPTSWGSVWPISLWFGGGGGGSAEAGAEAEAGAGLGAVHGRVVKVQTVQAWVPSTTKLSVQALWWGYRLYLPPPVLATLNDDTLEATKRAAMITTALTWFFNNLPISSLPAALQPAALLLQRLAPYLGYIGTFISWSWGTIKGYDIGYGVILSATWLLPVALIPSTWKATDFPTSPGQGAPARLPPQMTPTPSSPPTSLPTSPAPSSPPLSSGSPAPTSPTTTSPTPTPTSPTTPTPSTPTTTSTRRIAHIPVAPLPPEDTLPPVPPVPILVPAPVSRSSSGVPVPLPVPPDSPLGEQLLHGPLLGPVPLPEEGEDGNGSRGSSGEQVKPKKGVKSRTRALFARSPKA